MTGQKWVIDHYVNVSQAGGFDGDGAKVQETASSVTTYYLRSSALGGAIIEELNSSGQKNVGYVYAAGQLLARQAYGSVTWKHRTPTGTSEYSSITANSAVGRTEFDPLGADIDLNPPPTSDTAAC